MKCASASGTRAMVAKNAGMCPKAPVSLSKMGCTSGAACSLVSGPIDACELAVAVDILVFLSLRVSFPGAVDAGVQSDGAESAEESRVFDLDAVIYHDFEAGLPGALGGCFMNHAELHPDHFGPGGDGLFPDIRNGHGLTKNVHDFERAGHVAHGRIRAPAQHFRFARIHRRHIVAFRQHVDRRKVARPERIRREAHHGDALVRLQDVDAIRRRGCEPALIHYRVAAYAVSHYALLAESSAWPRSQRLPPISSLPTARRTLSLVIRQGCFSSALNCWCVVDAG